MERVMTDVMYEAPSGKAGKKVTITAEMVKEKLK
jgi:ATP-dependent protease Clp ATPase subunit